MNALQHLSELCRSLARAIPALGVIIWLTLLASSQCVAESPDALYTGRKLRQELQRPINVTRPQVRVREIITRLATLHHTAILLDRRIDPDRLIDVQLSQVTLNDGLEMLARLLDADAAVISGTVVIGPTDSLDRIRTDIVIQHQTLKDAPSEQAQRRLAGTIFRWDDLQTPRDLMQTIAEKFDVTVSHIELIPHDLWAAGVMADVSAAEALTLVAGQYDLTCLWNDDASAIRLAPAPTRLTIERELSADPANVLAILPLLPDEVPLAKVTARDGHMRIIGTVGEHERIAALLRGDEHDATLTPDQGPLRNRIFTLKTERAEAIAVIRTLKSQGIAVEYDSDALQAAGIDLSQKVTLSLDQATADEFFHALCDPIGLQFEIDGKSVRLTPQP